MSLIKNPCITVRIRAMGNRNIKTEIVDLFYDACFFSWVGNDTFEEGAHIQNATTSGSISRGVLRTQSNM